MSVMMSKDKKELIINCDCGCHQGVYLTKVEPDEFDDSIMFLTYISGNFYKEQEKTFRNVLREKIKKIWCIIRNKDFYYSDILMSKEDFQQFKVYINQFGE